MAGDMTLKQRLSMNRVVVAPGVYDALTASLAAAAGFRLVIFPGGIVRALARTAQDYYASLAKAGANQPFGDRTLDFSALNALIGTPEMLDLGRSYDNHAVKRREDAA